MLYLLETVNPKDVFYSFNPFSHWRGYSSVIFVEVINLKDDCFSLAIKPQES
jgi:hypothetical protein